MWSLGLLAFRRNDHSGHGLDPDEVIADAFDAGNILDQHSQGDALALVLSDPETMRYYPATLDRAGVAEWIERNRRRYVDAGHGLWAMVLKSNGELVGDCGLTRQPVDGTEEIEIGYHVRRDLWGRGYAPEAAGACREYGFARLGADRLISLIRPENLPAYLTEQVEDAATLNYHEGVQKAKRALVTAAERKANGNRAETARILGVDRSYLYNLLEELNLLANHKAKN